MPDDPACEAQYARELLAALGSWPVQVESQQFLVALGCCSVQVSCERLMRPDLLGRPVVVLSNNDGCAIARSNEAKALGVAMGQPWFQFRNLEKEAGLVALSANFTLYGDLSDRMMSVAAGLGPQQEIYSIDESFIGVAGVPNVTDRARRIRERILQWVGIPCGIGIGPTKTLAKLADHVAKTADRKPGSYALPTDELPTQRPEFIPALHAVHAALLETSNWSLSPGTGSVPRRAHPISAATQP